TYCTNNWLYQLTKPIIKDKNIGFICPMTTNCGNEAKQFFYFNDLDDLNRKVQKYYNNTERNNFELNRSAFFCVAGRKEIWYSVGLLDVNFGRGGWEDD